MNRINAKLAQIVETESRKTNTHSVLLAVSSGDGRVDFLGAGGTGTRAGADTHAEGDTHANADTRADLDAHAAADGGDAVSPGRD